MVWVFVSVILKQSHGVCVYWYHQPNIYKSWKYIIAFELHLLVLFAILQLTHNSQIF